MKYFYLVPLILALGADLTAQSTYNSTDFANNGDTFYLTKTQLVNSNFDTTGANITWNFAALAGTSQRRLNYRLPTQTGYSAPQWPYIYNTNNVNLSSTDEQTVAVFGVQETNPNDYFSKNNFYLRQKASSYTVIVNNTSVNVKNIYTSPDTVYKFPINYNSTNSSEAAYTINIPPNLYFRNVILSRRDTVNGWGTLITPYGTFTNCLKYVSDVTQVDSVSVYGNPINKNDTTIYREIKWFDPSKKYPLLYVKETKTGNNYIAQTIEYYDNKQYFQPAAFFSYLPLVPNMGDTLNFQNLSTNGYAYKWNFGDSSSGANDSSTQINPIHIYFNPGNYIVELIAYNGPLTDTFSLPLLVNPVNFTYTFNGDGNWSNAANWKNNLEPPLTLPATNNIIIDPVTGGACTLDVTQHVSQGASFTVNSGKNIIIPGVLKIQ